jgi:acetoin utilization protein AcuC
MAGRQAAGPVLVFGPRSLTYDFGPSHPLSPRRFGPGIELLRALGAEPGLAPEPSTDRQLEWLHSPEYLAAVRRFSANPGGPMPEAGIGPGDDPPFAGMHEAAAAVAGGSISAVERILKGHAEHAYHPGGGLHHAMRDRASGFCIYNDVALAIARARQEGLRVLYVDLDVHHGDGVQALHYQDPGVMTVSFHENGRALFPGSGFVDELGEGSAAGTSVNVPFEPMCGPDAWIDAVRALVPALAAAFGPDIVVSQHGADGHVWDPLAHLCLTTTVMGEAARLVDRIAHRYAGGRWLATGGGGYAIYRVVPRAWAMTWLAGAHLELPERLPPMWREKWAGEAERWESEPLPMHFDDEEGLGERLIQPGAEIAAERTVGLVRTLTLPALLRAAEERGWWAADGKGGGVAGLAGDRPVASAQPAPGEPTVVELTAESVAGLKLAPRVVAPANPGDGKALLVEALREGAVAVGAVAGEWLVGVAIAAPGSTDGRVGAGRRAGAGESGEGVAPVDDLLALGVAPDWRHRGVATALIRALAVVEDHRGRALVALHTTAERDPIDPLPRDVRGAVADRLLAGAGFSRLGAPGEVAAADPGSFLAAHLPPGASPSLLDRLGKR